MVANVLLLPEEAEYVRKLDEMSASTESYVKFAGNSKRYAQVSKGMRLLKAVRDMKADVLEDAGERCIR